MSFQLRVSQVLSKMETTQLEVVEQALHVFCYRAWKNDVTLVDIGHIVVRVSGATDQAGKNLLLGVCDSLWMKDYLHLKWHFKTTNILPYIFFNFRF